MLSLRCGCQPDRGLSAQWHLNRLGQADQEDDARQSPDSMTMRCQPPILRDPRIQDSRDTPARRSELVSHRPGSVASASAIDAGSRVAPLQVVYGVRSHRYPDLQHADGSEHAERHQPVARRSGSKTSAGPSGFRMRPRPVTLARFGEKLECGRRVKASYAQVGQLIQQESSAMLPRERRAVATIAWTHRSMKCMGFRCTKDSSCRLRRGVITHAVRDAGTVR